MAWQQYDTLYSVGTNKPFKLSRSKIDLFIDCPRCFWLDRRLGIKRPDTPPFQINKLIDELLKKEFDTYRSKKLPHPYMLEIGLKAVPFLHKDLDTWRHNFSGIQYLHTDTNLLIFGAIDDIWELEDGSLAIVDYKATAKNKEITDLDPKGGWHDAYRRQMEIYQWLFRMNGFSVSDKGYFVYANGRMSEKDFNNTVKFTTHTFPYEGKTDWIEPTIIRIKEALEGDIPEVGAGPLGNGCTHCEYAKKRTEMTLRALKK